MIMKGPSHFGVNFGLMMFHLKFLASSQTLLFTSNSVLHELLHKFIHSESFFSCFVEVTEAFFQHRESGFFNDVRDSLWFVPQHEVEWQLSHGQVGLVVVHKFHHGDVINPCFRVDSTEDAEIGLNLLIEPFCLSNHLYLLHHAWRQSLTPRLHPQSLIGLMLRSSTPSILAMPLAYQQT